MKNKKQDKNIILTLSPKIVENEVNDKYIRIIDNLLKIDDCKNIALIGGYGSGKSSLIKTYLYKRKKISKKALIITIGSYIIDNDISDEADNKIDSKEQILVNRVEESILKQIIYREKSSRFPKSSLIRFNKESWYKKLLYSSMILYSIWFPIFYYFKYFQQKLMYFNKLYNFFGIFGIIMFLIIVFTIYKFVHIIINKVKISKVTVKDCEIDLQQITNSIFSRYLSEIVYYFQVTKKNLVIFEDLDRFPDDVALKVIQELKELNTILNNGYGISKIIFLYAVRDNLFKNVEDKNKFYDYNLSILSISTSFNSELNLVGLLKQQNVYDNLSSKVIKITSKYIYDMRTLINIVNDYCLFKDITDTNNSDRLFSMLAFKNQYFKEYSLLQTSDDCIKKIFDTIEEKRESLINNNKNQIEKLKEKIKRRKDDILKDELELKHLLLSYNTRRDNDPRPITHYYINNKQIDISEFLKDDFDIDILKDSEFSLKRYYDEIDEQQVFSKFGSKEQFLDRFNSLSNDEEIEGYEKEISELNKEINNIKLFNSNKILKRYFEVKGLALLDDKKETIKNPELLFELISNGFICEDYMDYVTSPVIYKQKDDIESLTYSDSKYLMDIRQEKYSYSTKLVGYNTILERIEDDLSSPYVLNYDLFNYLLNNNKSETIEKILIQFSKFTDINIKFLIEFFKIHDDKTNNVLKLISDKKYDIWGGYIENEEKLTKEDGIFLVEKILLSDNYVDNINDLTTIKSFIEKNEVNGKFITNDLMNKLNVKNNLLKIKPRLKNIEYLDKENYLFVYKNNLYAFNDINIKRIVQTNLFNINNLKNNEETREIYDYIKDSIVIFCNEYYNNHDIIFDDTELVKSVFYNADIGVDTKHLLLSREKIKFRNASDVEQIYFEDLIKYDHLFINWSNIISLYKIVDTNRLFNYVTENIKKLILKQIQGNLEEKKTKSFFSKYILFLINTDLAMTEKLLNIYKVTYEEIKNLTLEELNLLISYNCICYNKNNYKYICSIMNIEEREEYIKQYYFNKQQEITKFLNIVSVEDVELLLKSQSLNNDEKVELLYSLYKKEKRVDMNIATNNFVSRLEFSFRRNKWHNIRYNNAIYNGILKKLNSNNTFKKFQYDINNISFIL